MEILLASPRGFCAGVVRAVELVDSLLQSRGAPVYVRHQLVHNRRVVQELEARGVIFVDEVDEVPPGSVLVFSAHGVAQAVEHQAMGGDYDLHDATCPLVTKVHTEVVRYARRGMDCILVGHAGHPEVEGTLGRFDHSAGGRIYLVQDAEEARNVLVRDPQRLAWVTQTTLSMDDTARILTVLKERFPDIHGPAKDDICYATQNRQDAVKQLALEVDLVLVVGSQNSSNSNRLCEIAKLCGADAFLLDEPGRLDQIPLRSAKRIGVTSGASTPESLVDDVLLLLQEMGGEIVGEIGSGRENISFSLPPSVRAAADESQD